VAGWCYLWIAGLSAARTRGRAAFRPRLAVDDNTTPSRRPRCVSCYHALNPAADTVFAFDAGFDPVQLTVGCPTWSPDRGAYPQRPEVLHPAPPRHPGQRGRPRRHGDRFSSPTDTWPATDTVHMCDDEQYGHVDVQAWQPPAPPPAHLPRPRRRDEHRGGHHHPGPGLPAARPRNRQPKPCGCGGLDPTAPPQTWTGSGGLHPQIRYRTHHPLRQTDPRRDHPKIRTPDRPTDDWLILAALTQLRLARGLVADIVCPGTPLTADKMTPGPGRFRPLLPRSGHSNQLAKPSDRPGRPTGRNPDRTPLSQRSRRPAPSQPTANDVNAKLRLPPKSGHV